MLRKCFGEPTVSRTQVFEWHKGFDESPEVVKNLHHASCPSIFANEDKSKKQRTRKSLMKRVTTHIKRPHFLQKERRVRRRGFMNMMSNCPTFLTIVNDPKPKKQVKVGGKSR